MKCGLVGVAVYWSYGLVDGRCDEEVQEKSKISVRFGTGDEISDGHKRVQECSDSLRVQW